MPCAPRRTASSMSLGKLDVRLQADDVPVQRLGGQRRAGCSSSVSISMCLLLHLAMLGELLGVGVDDHHAASAVDDDGIAAAHFAVILPRPTTAGMPIARATIAVWLVRPPTSVAKPLTCTAIEGRGLAGQQIVGDDDDVAA